MIDVIDYRISFAHSNFSLAHYRFSKATPVFKLSRATLFYAKFFRDFIRANRREATKSFGKMFANAGVDTFSK